MANIHLLKKLSEEIEQLRAQLGEEWKQNHLLSTPSIIVISQTLDGKINEFIKLNKR